MLSYSQPADVPTSHTRVDGIHSSAVRVLWRQDLSTCLNLEISGVWFLLPAKPRPSVQGRTCRIFAHRLRLLACSGWETTYPLRRVLHPPVVGELRSSTAHREGQSRNTHRAYIIKHQIYEGTCLEPFFKGHATKQRLKHCEQRRLPGEGAVATRARKSSL